MRQTDHRLSQFERQLQHSEDASLDTRFKDAIQLLGSEDRSVRIGGLYILLEAAKNESKRSREQEHYCSSYPKMVVEIICGFIRNQSQKDFTDYVQSGKEKLQHNNPYITKYPEIFDKVVDMEKGELRNFENLSPSDQAAYDSVRQDFDLYIKEYKTYDDIQTALNILFLSYKDERGYQNVSGTIKPSENFKRLQLIEKYQERIFYSLKRKDFNLSGVKLQQVNLHQAHLKNINFAFSDLKYVVLWDANLEGVWFYNADFREVKFNNANLKSTHFYNVKFQNIEFDGASLQHAHFERGTFKDVDFKVSTLHDTKFREIDLSGAQKLSLTLFSDVFTRETVFFFLLYWDKGGRDYYSGELSHEHKEEFERRYNPPLFIDCYLYDDQGDKLTDIIDILDYLLRDVDS